MADEKREKAFTDYLKAKNVDVGAREYLIQFTAIWLALVEKGILTNEETMSYYKSAEAHVDKQLAACKKEAEEKLEKEMPGMQDIMGMFGLDKIL